MKTLMSTMCVSVEMDAEYKGQRKTCFMHKHASCTNVPMIPGEMGFVETRSCELVRPAQEVTLV